MGDETPPRPVAGGASGAGAARESDSGSLGEQLDLFSQRAMQAGEGYAALGELDFERAATAFQDVLRRHPSDSAAADGVRAVEHWRQVIVRAEAMGPAERARSVWDEVRRLRDAAGLLPIALNEALVGYVVELLNTSGSVLVPPDLCAGVVYLEIGRHREAEASLAAALEREPDNARLLGYLGDALWCQDRLDEAREVYARALLLGPDDISVEQLRDRELKSLIRARGPVWAPAHGWIDGLLPLAADEDLVRSASPAAEACRRLRLAETAKRRGEHDAMVSHRLWLKGNAPAVFKAYMARFP